MKGEDENRRGPVVRTTLEAIYIFTHFLAPVIPLVSLFYFNYFMRNSNTNFQYFTCFMHVGC